MADFDRQALAARGPLQLYGGEGHCARGARGRFACLLVLRERSVTAAGASLLAFASPRRMGRPGWTFRREIFPALFHFCVAESRTTFAPPVTIRSISSASAWRASRCSADSATGHRPPLRPPRCERDQEQRSQHAAQNPDRRAMLPRHGVDRVGANLMCRTGDAAASFLDPNCLGYRLPSTEKQGRPPLKCLQPGANRRLATVTAQCAPAHFLLV